MFRGKIHIFWVSVEVNAILEPFHRLLGKIGTLKRWAPMDEGFSTRNDAIFEFHTMDVVNSEGALESFWNFGLSRTVAPLHGSL